MYAIRYVSDWVGEGIGKKREKRKKVRAIPNQVGIFRVGSISWRSLGARQSVSESATAPPVTRAVHFFHSFRIHLY